MSEQKQQNQTKKRRCDQSVNRTFKEQTAGGAQGIYTQFVQLAAPLSLRRRRVVVSVQNKKSV